MITTYLFEFKDVEMWMPEVVSLAIKLCFRAKDKRAIFLPNLGKILHYQNEGNSDMIETDVYQYVKLHHEVKNFVDRLLWADWAKTTYIRAATAAKDAKDWSLPSFGATLTLSQPGGADYAHPILGSLAG